MSEALTEDAIRNALREVIDPELGYNIIDLGLVYDIHTQGSHVEIAMTMTTPGCPAAGFIESGVQHRLEAIPGVESQEVHVVWMPPWSPDMMSPDAKAHFGFA